MKKYIYTLLVTITLFFSASFAVAKTPAVDIPPGSGQPGQLDDTCVECAKARKKAMMERFRYAKQIVNTTGVNKKKSGGGARIAN